MSEQRHSRAATPFSRRTFLGVMGGAAATAVLTACGQDAKGGASTPTSDASPSSSRPAKLGGDLNLYVWEGYDKPADMAAWLTKNDINLHVKYITTPEEVPTILKGAGGGDWDMSYGDNVVMDYYEQLGLLRLLTVEDLPQLDGLLPVFKKPPFTNADGKFRGIPWTWGFSGLTYRSDRVAEPKSWEDLLKPAAKGKVATVDGALNNVALACIAVGIDPDGLTKADLEGEVASYLKSLLGQMKVIASSIGDQISLLTSGDIDYMSVGLKFMDAETAAAGVETKTIVPKEGAIGWADTTFITATAPHLDNAMAFGARLLDPQFCADANSDILQGPGVEASIELLSAEAKEQYPYDDLDHYLSDTLTFNQGWPHEPDGDKATYQDVLNLWQNLKSAV